MIPSNIGLDGTADRRSLAGGKWYGGTYGWGFSVRVPRTGAVDHRNRVPRSIIGFMNAYLLTGDDRYLDAWRKQADAIDAQGKPVDGRWMTPRMFGDDGWYAYAPGPYRDGSPEIYYLSMKSSDRERTGHDPWLSTYPRRQRPRLPGPCLAKATSTASGKQVKGMRDDPTTPDTRLADDPMAYNPASVTALIELMEGAFTLTRPGQSVLHCRLRYF